MHQHEIALAFLGTDGAILPTKNFDPTFDAASVLGTSYTEALSEQLRRQTLELVALRDAPIIAELTTEGQPIVRVGATLDEAIEYVKSTTL